MLTSLVRSIALGAVLLVGVAHAVDVTTCGQTLHPGDVGVLQNDLTCITGSGIRLENGSVLDLGGHTLTIQMSSFTAVECLARCSVLGPGVLTRVGAGPGGGGVVSNGKGRVIVTGVVLDGFAIAIEAPFARLSLTNTTIQNSILGADARRIDVDNVTITTVASPSNTCLTAFTNRIRGQDVTLGGCGVGIQVGRSVDLTRLTWANGSIGVITRRRIRLVDSSVTGASTVDVASGRLPRLVNTTCDHSLRLDSSGVITPEPWGVCASD
jgi:hypothetical protein